MSKEDLLTQRALVRPARNKTEKCQKNKRESFKNNTRPDSTSGTPKVFLGAKQ